jgi:hypothetical protein
LGSAAAPSISFTGDTNTGIYSPGADTLAISTDGTGRLTIDSSGNINIDSGTVYVDAVNNRLGIGTSSPSQLLTTVGNIKIAGAQAGNLAKLCLTRTDTSWSINNETDLRFYYGSGDTDSPGSASVVFTGSGRVGIGSISPENLLTVSTNTDGTSSLLKLHADADGVNNGLAGIKFSGNAGNHAAYIYGGHSTSGNTFLSFYTDVYPGSHNPQEKMRLDANGRLLVGTTNTNPYGNSVTGTVIEGNGIFNTSANNNYAGAFNRMNSDGQLILFGRNGSTVGSIAVTPQSTSYHTSSDYRLKKNVTAVTDGIARLQQLKPIRFNFISDPSKIFDGFFAHEVQTIVPEAIFGEKDAVDDDNNPIYQGIDQSKLVPLLTAALQEAVTKIESLEARLTAAGI